MVAWCDNIPAIVRMIIFIVCIFHAFIGGEACHSTRAIESPAGTGRTERIREVCEPREESFK